MALFETEEPAALPFTLDLSAAGLHVRLADLRSGLLKVIELTMEAPPALQPLPPERPADVARALRNRLLSLAVEVDEEDLAGALRPHGVSARLRADGARLTWTTGAVRATARAHVLPDTASLPTGPGLALSIDDVRVYGFVPAPWPRAVGTLTDRLPQWLAPRSSRTGATLATVDVVRAALRNVLPAAGWKLPDSSTATIRALVHTEGRVSVRLGTELSERSATAPSVGDSAHQEAAARLRLKRAHGDLEATLATGDATRSLALLRRWLESGADEAYVQGRFLEVALAEPLLHGQCAAIAQARIALDPDDTLAHCALLAVGEHAGDLALAMASASRLAAIADGAGEPFDLIAAATTLARLGGTGGTAAVERALRRAAGRCPDEPSLLRDLASAASSAGLGDVVRGLRQRLLLTDLRDDDAAAVATELARDALSEGDQASARVYVDFALRRAPDAATVLELAADAARLRGDAAARRDALMRLASPEVAANDPGVAGRAMRALAQELPPPEGVAHARRARALDPTDTANQVALAEAYERAGDVPAAFAEWRALAASGDAGLEGRAAAHLAALATASPSLRHAARLHVAQIVAQRPSQAEALDALALLADDTSSWDEVLGAYERAARATAGGPLAAHFELLVGLVQEDRLGLAHDAMDAYERALDADPEGTGAATARERLARLYEQLGRWDRLSDLLRRTARESESASDQVAAKLRLAALCMGPLGRRAEAVAILRELLEERPRDLSVLRAAAGLLRDPSSAADVDLRTRVLLRLAALAPAPEGHEAAAEAASVLAGVGRQVEARAVLVQAGLDHLRVQESVRHIGNPRPEATDASHDTRAASDAAAAGDLERALSLLAPHVLCERPDSEAADLLCELLEATGRVDDLAAVEAHLRAAGA